MDEVIPVAYLVSLHLALDDIETAQRENVSGRASAAVCEFLGCHLLSASAIMALMWSEICDNFRLAMTPTLLLCACTISNTSFIPAIFPFLYPSISASARMLPTVPVS